MLVLTRKVGEQIMIGDDITIRVLHYKNGVVSIGIAAPRHIKVDREEVRLRKDEKKQTTIQGGGNR